MLLEGWAALALLVSLLALAVLYALKYKREAQANFEELEEVCDFAWDVQQHPFKWNFQSPPLYSFSDDELSDSWVLHYG